MDSLTLLQEGATVEVIKEFCDFDGNAWPAGSQLRGFKQYNCVPYHGGYTFFFENATLRLCDNEPSNNEVLFRSQRYFRVLSAPA
jgi:hypothetical protein